MPEKRLQKCRELNRELNCKHMIWLFLENSNYAPLIEADGSRTTIQICMDCGYKLRYNRTQAEFIHELELAMSVSFQDNA